MLRSHQKTNQQVDMTVAKHAKSVRNGPIVEFLWQEVASNLVGSMPLHLLGTWDGKCIDYGG
jgi:hypothetical protein